MKCFICDSRKLKFITGLLRNNFPGKVYYCSRCDLGMLSKPAFNAKHYYEKEYRLKFTDNLKNPNSTPSGIFRVQKEYQKDRLAIVKPYFNKHKSFLEIGSSAGQFLSHVINRFGHCEGIELNSVCARYVEKKLGIKIHTEELKFSSIKEKSFDYISAFQVLEHVVDPLGFMLRAKEYLKKDGRIFIEVPNIHDPLLTLWNIDYYKQFYYHEAHLSYFSEKSLGRLCLKTGYEIEKMYFIQDYNLFNHLYWYFNNRPQDSCEPGLSRPIVKFSKKYKEAGSEINQLFVKSDRKYKKLLIKHKLTSNIFFIAKPL